jgi:signal transduction histidine kinase/CheY-like chemotaxis protein
MNPTEMPIGRPHPPIRRHLNRQLLKLAMAPLLVAFPAILIVIVIVAGPRYDAQLQSTARSNLAAAHNYLDQQIAQTEQYVEQMTHSERLPEVMSDDTRLTELDQILSARAEATRLDFLTIADQQRRVVASSSGLPRGAVLPESFLLAQAVTGIMSSGFERFDAEELRMLARNLPAQARVPPDPAGVPDRAVAEERGGLLIAAASHFPLSNDYQDAVLYGGYLLNNNQVLIDRIREVVFPVIPGIRKLDGVAALFLDDVQIATTLIAPDGRHAVGTRAPAEVSRVVLGSGDAWNRRARLLDEPYVSAYEAIVDHQGKRLGMLFAGFPEKPYQTVEWLVFGSIAGLLAVSMLGLSFIFQRGTRGIVMRLGAAVAAMKAVQAGDRQVRIQPDREGDEITELGRNFNELLDALWVHEEAREAYVAERNQLNSELERHRNHLEDLVLTRTRELAEARDEAESASRAKSTFLANMSHELRTPMNAIMGMTELALNRATDPKQIDFLNKSRQASKHLLQIINDVLDISKIEADRMTLAMSLFTIGDTLAQTDNMLRAKAAEKGLDLRMEISPELESAAVVGDPLRLQQILLNLAANAIKFTDAGYVAVRVLRRGERGRHLELRFEIEDTGIGVSQDECQRLFQPFEQADGSLTRKYGGTGLGLALCQRLVTLMGGVIGVDSQPGEGSVFWFEIALPRAVPGQRSQAVEPDAEPSLWLDEYAARHILCVEDDPINQDVVLSALTDAGLRVDVASDGLEAVSMAAAGRYDMILMDMQMPGMNGIDATRLIRAMANFHDVPILAMTANAYDEDRERCLAAGMNDHIGKPVTPSALLDVMGKWFGLAEAARRSTRLEAEGTKQESDPVP